MALGAESDSHGNVQSQREKQEVRDTNATRQIVNSLTEMHEMRDDCSNSKLEEISELSEEFDLDKA